jgi:pimeloyl-ACP methyl ester carboxylesterase
MECRSSACAHPTARRVNPAAKEVVVLLHGSAGSSALWNVFRERLAPAYDVVAPDLIGYGDAIKWPEGRGLSLDDEVGRIEGRIPCCEGGFHLLGYSYGGAVALAFALSQPVRRRGGSVRSASPCAGQIRGWADKRRRSSCDAGIYRFLDGRRVLVPHAGEASTGGAVDGVKNSARLGGLLRFPSFSRRAPYHRAAHSPGPWRPQPAANAPVSGRPSSSDAG